MKDNRKKRKRFLPIWFLLIALLIGGCGSETESRQTDAITQQTLTETADTLEETQEQRAVVASDETESAAKTQDEITDYATEKSSVLTMDEIPAFADAPIHICRKAIVKIIMDLAGDIRAGIKRLMV